MPENVKVSSTDSDLLAWQAICGWFQEGAVAWKYNGYDLPLLVRPLLWNKVGPTIRREGTKVILTSERHNHRLSCAIHQVALEKRRLRELIHRVSHRNVYKNAVFIPYVSRPIAKVAAELTKTSGRQVLTLINEQDIRGVKTIKEQPSQPALFSPAHIECLLRNIVEGLAFYDVNLGDDELRCLRIDLHRLGMGLLRAEYTLKKHWPKLIIVHADNHPPHYWYVFAAKKLGIPVFMLQHGLDCERYYLDEPYTDYIAVWGEERKRRYAAHNRFGCHFRVTGNPQYDDYTPPVYMNADGDYWLWITRPHTAEKCYAPSRYEEEGEEILAVLLDSLKCFPNEKLVIKPHPYDCVDRYEHLVEQQGLKSRVSISNRPTLELYEGASLVFAEDSTAGLEAMFFGKPLVHCHFAKSAPVMPFVDYGAALPGFNELELQGAVAKIQKSTDFEAMFAGQQRFIADFSYQLDSNSGKRVLAFIEDVLNGKAKEHI